MAAAAHAEATTSVGIGASGFSENSSSGNSSRSGPVALAAARDAPACPRSSLALLEDAVPETCSSSPKKDASAEDSSAPAAACTGEMEGGETTGLAVVVAVSRLTEGVVLLTASGPSVPLGAFFPRTLARMSAQRSGWICLLDMFILRLDSNTLRPSATVLSGSRSEFFQGFGFLRPFWVGAPSWVWGGVSGPFGCPRLLEGPSWTPAPEPPSSSATSPRSLGGVFPPGRLPLFEALPGPFLVTLTPTVNRSAPCWLTATQR